MSPTFSSPHDISFDAIFEKMPLLKTFFELLPKALYALLKKDGESLERLQLIEISLTKKAQNVSHPNDKIDLGPVTIRRLTDGDLFLKLDFVLLQKEDEVMSCEITYFIRGQKKFFRPEVPDIISEILGSGSFHPDHVRAFFAHLNQANPMFFNPELVGLARTTLVVPSQIIVAYLLRMSSETLKKSRIIFFSELIPEETFTMHDLVKSAGFLMMSNNRPIACHYSE